jgi:hypothetical protein
MQGLLIDMLGARAFGKENRSQIYGAPKNECQKYTELSAEKDRLEFDPRKLDL